MIYALCSTYRHPELLASTLAQWNAQDYPADQRRLLILDDAQTFDSQQGDNWDLVSWPTRFPSLPAKYNHLLSMVPDDATGVLVMDDDNTLLPGYVSAHASALEKAEFSTPNIVFTDTAGYVKVEHINGWFHSAIGIRLDLMKRIGGWPNSPRADFDYQILGALHQHAKSKAEPWATVADCQYVFRWNTGRAHGQWTHKDGPGDEQWYDRCAIAYTPVPYVGQLVPQYDHRTLKVLNEVGQLKRLAI